MVLFKISENRNDTILSQKIRICKTKKIKIKNENYREMSETTPMFLCDWGISLNNEFLEYQAGENTTHQPKLQSKG